jgi:recombination protein RecT
MANPQPPAAPAKPEEKKLTPFEEVRRTLLSEEMKAQLCMALPPQMPPEKFQRVAVTAVNKNPDLLNCTRGSLYQSFMLAAQDGLLPDGREAAIVRYMNKGEPTATYMPMVGGILKKIRNSGELAAITAQVIHKNDPFRYWVDDSGEHLTHEPELFGDRGQIIGVYALAKTKDGAVYIEVLTKDDVEKVRAVSRAKDSGPWVQWWDEMAKKTAIRRLSKRLPMSTDLDELIRRDDEIYDVEKPSETEPKPAKGPGRLSKMLGNAGQVVETSGHVVRQPAAAPSPAEAPAASEPLLVPETAEEPAYTPPAESFALTCVDCGFGTNEQQAMADHKAVTGHGPKQAPKKNGGGGSLFNQ